MKPRHAAYDPVLKSRYCATCGQPLVGYTEVGLTLWLDAEPCTRAVEAVYHAAGRYTYSVRVRRGGSAWVDRRVQLLRPAELVLAQHPHQTPGPAAPDPPWLMRRPEPRPISDVPGF